ncbi:urea ABC transporter ATP-binding subunit UrtE [Geomicrobium sediminis]|uniref:Urea transport system ATP-binding protein n=1 Tax=Geomicrobium sediminis TaxID=1347788 RepID=A0ABS2PCX5_9BACL|nr:urea ABC transporter ATP-binding subunit UrtE [Geomicrobium sediminis]MBM7633285.1 urea transport system ATP-binding protein [Geomicrobium sediminis]
MLELNRIEAGYGESAVLRDVSLTIPKGKLVCLLGRNGVGKSTLLKTLMGLIKVNHGHIDYQSHNINDKSPTWRSRKGIGYIPQGREIFSTLTVHENLQLGLEARQDQKKNIEPGHQVYDYFPILKDMQNRKGGDLSGGQQQQLAIARTLVADPDVILLDEPTEGIQPNIVQDIQDVIKDLKQTNEKTMLLVEQSFDFASEVADYFYVMDRGRIVYEGEREELTEENMRGYLSI